MSQKGLNPSEYFFYLLDFSLLWMERNFDKGVTFSHEIHLWEVLWYKETKTEQNEVDERETFNFVGACAHVEIFYPKISSSLIIKPH